jgi:hypothetical protein
MPETFLTYRGKRWLWFGLISSIFLVVSYLLYRRQMAPSGGTFMGLLYGVIGTVVIVILMLLGLRKRAYASGLGTVQGWTSAHVYLGLLTLLLIPMHAGFKFGLDVHTLAFVLLAIVVVSGVVGVMLYQALPSQLTKFESGLQADKVDKEINRLLSEIRTLSKDKSDAFVGVYRDEVRKTRALSSRGWSLLWRGPDEDPVSRRAKELAQTAAQIPDHEQDAFQTLSKLLLQKSQLESNLMSQMRLKNALEAWLYVHVPVSIAMVVAVVVHVVAVFYY